MIFKIVTEMNCKCIDTNFFREIHLSISFTILDSFCWPENHSYRSILDSIHAMERNNSSISFDFFNH